MRITVREGGGKNICLIFPTGLVLNRVTAAIGSVQLRKENISISAEQLHVLFRTIKDYKKAHRDWKMVEVQSSEGDMVEIVM